MIYDTLSKGEDGLYHTRALTDERKRYFVQLNGVTVTDVDQETGEVSLEIIGEDNQAKIESVHVMNIQSAMENSATWFGKELPERLSRVLIPGAKIYRSIEFRRPVFSAILRKLWTLMLLPQVQYVRYWSNFQDSGSRRKLLVRRGILFR